MAPGKLTNLARMTTPTAGTGTLTLGAAVPGFLTFANSGVLNGDVVSYGITDGNNSEVGTGTYSSAGPTLTRSVTKSTNADAAIALSGSAQVFVCIRSEDYVSRSGDTLTGILTLNGTCTANLHAVHKAYVDNNFASVSYVDSQAALRVAKSGDTMTGTLTLATSSPTITLNKSAAGQLTSIWSMVAGNARWQIQPGNAAAESGSNAGSDFIINRYSDAGSPIDAPFSINRATAQITMTGALTVSPASGNPVININKSASGLGNFIQGFTNNKARWNIVLGDAGTESGGNNGSDFIINRYNDAGTILSSPVNINRSTGTISVNGAFQAVSGDIYAMRAGAPTQGLYQFGNAGTKYLHFDGTNFQLNGGPLVVNSILYVYGGVNVSANQASAAFSFVNNDTSVNGSGIYARCFNDGAQAIAVMNAAGSQWTHVLHGNGNSEQIGIVTASTVIASGSTGITVNGTVVSGTTTQNLVMANPNWGAMYFQSCHVPGVEVYWWLQCPTGGTSYQFGANTPFARKPGGGTWSDISDARIKTVTGNYEHGLDEIMQLNPVRFVFNGNDSEGPPSHVRSGEEVPEELQKIAPKVPYGNSSHSGVAKSGQEFIGLVAQEAEVPMPEMVNKRKGYIDGELVDDLRDLDSHALVFALVNAVKALKGQIGELQARIGTLEARPSL